MHNKYCEKNEFIAKLPLSHGLSDPLPGPYKKPNFRVPKLAFHTVSVLGKMTELELPKLWVILDDY